ncbi:MAG: hypothetical protein SXV54_06580 [Chloroflexota bacterium]|nr:hypothetical protein [Chloroflexota bacterium]
MNETVVTLDGRTFRVDPCGFYEELIEVPLDGLVMKASSLAEAAVHTLPPARWALSRPAILARCG